MCMRFPLLRSRCEMVPPVRMWANTYYTVPFFQPPNAPPSHNASTFLVIASKKGQKIFRFDAAAQQKTLYCQLDKYETYWRNDIAEGSKWTSDAPFLLAQYVNSASYPDNQNGEGDPRKSLFLRSNNLLCCCLSIAGIDRQSVSVYELRKHHCKDG